MAEYVLKEDKKKYLEKKSSIEISTNSVIGAIDVLYCDIENMPAADVQPVSVIKELEAKHFSECAQIAHYDDELRKAKELLKVMYEDIKRYAGGMCRVCTECNADFECKCEDFCATNKRSKWKYKYEPEILALIGEDGELNG